MFSWYTYPFQELFKIAICLKESIHLQSLELYIQSSSTVLNTKRQLRATHSDEHYCCTQFKYFKERGVEQREIVAVFVCDVKVKIPVGEPDAPISTGVI